jgi:hypothetical protein
MPLLAIASSTPLVWPGHDASDSDPACWDEGKSRRADKNPTS